MQCKRDVGGRGIYDTKIKVEIMRRYNIVAGKVRLSLL